MPGQIFLLDERGGLRSGSMTESPYDTEGILQKTLATHPALLAGDQIDPDNPRKWILVSREVSVPSTDAEVGRWSPDHLFLDQDASPSYLGQLN